MSDLAFRSVLEILSFLNSVVSLYFLLRILPVRRRGALVAAAVVPNVLVSVLRLVERGNSGSLLWMLYELLLPLPFWRAPLAHRLLASSASICLKLALEMLMGVVWILATGTPNASYDAASLSPVLSVLGRVLFLVLYLGGATLLLRAGSRIRSDAVRRMSLVPLCALVMVQVAVIELLFLPGFAELGGEVPYYLGGLLVLVVCVLADVALFAASRRYFEERGEREYADALERSLDECLREEAARMTVLRDAARVRHDLRNHLQVVSGLISRGRVAEAGAYARRMAEGAPGGGRGDGAEA